MSVLARMLLSVSLTALSAPVGLSALTPSAIAMPANPDQPALPHAARQSVAARQWTSLLLDALNGDAAAAARIGEAYTHGPSRDVPEAMRWLSRGADLGSMEARRELGLLLLRGDETQKDADHAATLLRQAAEAGDGEAQAALGVMYAYGDGVPQDWPLAVEWSRRAAEQDDAWGQANLGLYLEQGRTGDSAPEEAAKWYRRAADHGFALALTRLGLLYERGAGVPADAAKAFGLFLQAAQQEDAISERILAVAFRDGIGTAANQAEAVAWMTRSAEHGDADAMYLLSGMYASGAGIAKSQAQAWQHLVDAAYHGHALAAARVGLAYVDGTFGMDPDTAEAETWLTLALDHAGREAFFDPETPGTFRARELARARYRLALLIKGREPERSVDLLRQALAHDCPNAGFELGRMRRTGDGLPRDDADAARLFEAAANNGVAAAAYALADGYIAGWAGSVSQPAALRWYRRAAALGQPEAWLVLGRIYEEANGVAADPAEALTWYQMAGNNGVVAAQMRLGDVSRRAELGQPLDERVALRWYQLAAGQGDASAEERIGDLYWQGSPVLPRNRAEAVRHYRTAASRGAVVAQRKLAIAYANGDGVAADDSRMLAWSRKAAQGGDAIGAGMLGYAIMIGLDGTYDMVEAATWLSLAADQVHESVWRERLSRQAHEAVARLTTAERAIFEVRMGRRQVAAVAGGLTATR